MFADNTLTPKEAIRLCALGTLASGPIPYSALANAIRHFVGRVMGPSLDIMGQSIELLKYEGLVEAVEGSGPEDDAPLALTEAGWREIRFLLTANIRAAATEFNKLIVALKFRFLHLLEANEQADQAYLLQEACENELVRLEDLRQHHADDEGFLTQWLDHDIAQLEDRLVWLEAFRNTVKNPG